MFPPFLVGPLQRPWTPVEQPCAEEGSGEAERETRVPVHPAAAQPQLRSLDGGVPLSILYGLG